MNLTLGKQLTATYDEALARLLEALQREGFGVLTEIDVKRARGGGAPCLLRARSLRCPVSVDHTVEVQEEPAQPQL